MKIKIQYIILALVIVVLSLYLLLRNPDRNVFDLPDIPPLDADAITRIEIDAPERKVILHREGGDWRMPPQGHPVDSRKIEDMLAAMADLSLTAFISESKNYARYELDDDHRIRVRAYEGEALQRELSIGKVADSQRHTFVRLPTQSAVYHARDNLKRVFDQDREALRDKTVLSFAADGVSELQLGKTGQEVIFVRTGDSATNAAEESVEQEAGSEAASSVWRTTQGRAADTARLERLLKDLSSLKCESFMTAEQKAALGDPIFSFNVSGAESAALTIFKAPGEDDTRYAAVSSQNDDAFFLRKWKADDLMKDPQSLMPAETSAEQEG